MEFKSLKTASPDLVSEVLRDEAREWQETLGWDITDIQRIVHQAVCQRVAPGVLALDGGRPAGFAYYSVEGERGVLGTLVVAPKYRSTTVGNQLARYVIGQMRDEGTLRRIESQTLFIKESGAGRALHGLGFEEVPRQFLTKNLATRSRSNYGITLKPLTLQRLNSVAQVLFRSMAGSLDAAISADFESAESCQRNLEAMMVWHGCGSFEPTSSAIATNARGYTIGMIVTTRLSRTRALIGHIPVLPEYQAQGVGHALMSYACDALSAKGFEDVALTVTEDNQAREWYLRLGFHNLHSFDAYVWTDGEFTEPQSAECASLLKTLRTK